MTAIPKAVKRKKRPRQNWSAQCDLIFSRLVRRPGRCHICGSTERLQCAHGFSRRYRAVRWDFRNAWCLCAKDHVFYTHHPLEWTEWLREQWGDVLYAEMLALALSGVRPELKELLAQLRAIEAGRTQAANPSDV